MQIFHFDDNSLVILTYGFFMPAMIFFHGRAMGPGLDPGWGVVYIRHDL